jgi:hypothetical protein
MPARYSFPSRQRNSLMSATQRSSGRSAPKFRCNRSGAGDDGGVAALAPAPAGVGSDEAVGPHEAGDAVTTDPVAATAELAPHPRRPVRAPRGGVQLPDLVEEDDVGLVAGRRAPVPPGVVPGAGHPADAAQVADAVLGLVLVNEAEARHRLVSRAK